MLHDDKYRDWLILSLKWSGDELVWYASGFAGYTKNLLRAGRYTEAEAKREAGRVDVGVLEAVHFDVAMSMSRTWVTADNGTDQMAKLRERMAARERKAVVS